MKIQYEPMIGESITTAAQKAVAMANAKQCDVDFTFNEIELVATPGASPSRIVAVWKHILARKREEYERSAEGIAARAKHGEDIRRHQEMVDNLITYLPGTVENGDPGALLTWLKGFALHSDWIGVKFNKDYVASVLETRFKNNDATGLSREAYRDKDILLRYIFGQVINCLREGMPPHPIFLTFIEQWRKL